MSFHTNSISRRILWLVMIVYITIFSSFGLWKSNRITLDAPSYYAYLPAVFIHGDLKMNYIDQNPDFYKDKIWYYRLDNKQKLIKHPMGISVALTPFFLAGHVAAKVTGAAQDGYSLPYQNAASIGVLLYLLLGLWCLRATLRFWFSEQSTALTVLAITLGTNLLWYSGFEGLMPHAISFSLMSGCLYTFFSWLRTEQQKYVLWFALGMALILLIRPLSVIAMFYFVIVGVYDKGGLRAFLNFCRQQYKAVLGAKLMIIAIVSLQFFYWKYITGHWFYDVYKDEHFIFSKPQILPFLFSFRKGLFIYTPILIFGILGLFGLRRIQRGAALATIVCLSVTVFVLSSWWAWSYGICWGMRPMIDYYPMLAIPMAFFFSRISGHNLLRIGVTYVLVPLLILLNLFQTWQYKKGLIHFDDMSKAAYFKGFFQTKASAEWQELLTPYDWDRRMKGLDQLEFNEAYLQESYGKKDMYLRAFNHWYVAPNEKAGNMIAAFYESQKAPCLFRVEVVHDNVVCLRSAAGYLFSVNAAYANVLVANAARAGVHEQFEIHYLEEGDNRITLKAYNGKYVSVRSEWPNILFAEADAPSKQEMFKLFTKE